MEALHCAPGEAAASALRASALRLTRRTRVPSARRSVRLPNIRRCPRRRKALLRASGSQPLVAEANTMPCGEASTSSKPVDHFFRFRMVVIVRRAGASCPAGIEEEADPPRFPISSTREVVQLAAQLEEKAARTSPPTPPPEARPVRRHTRTSGGRGGAWAAAASEFLALPQNKAHAPHRIRSVRCSDCPSTLRRRRAIWSIDHVIDRRLARGLLPHIAAPAFRAKPRDRGCEKKYRAARTRGPSVRFGLPSAST